jgi:hypothetical protein
MKITVYSLGAILAFTLFFYFYPAAIFEAEIVERPETRYVLDISLQGLLDQNALPEKVDPNLVIESGLTLKGWFLLVICLIGVPIMIGYRLANQNIKTND